MFSKKYTTVFFIFLFFIPLIDGIIHFSPRLLKAKNTENRTLAQSPTMNIDNLDKFPSKYENYYNDHFMLRDVFISWYNRVRAVYFNVSPVPDKAIIGKNGWLFFTGKELPLFRNTDHFSFAEMDFILKKLERRKKYFEERNCSMYIFIVPPKSLVYPEYIGESIKENYLKTNGQLLTEYIKKNSRISITYLLQELLNAKNKSKPDLFAHTDNHWSEYGAYIGCKAMTKEIKFSFKELQPIEDSLLLLKDTVAKSGNIANMIGISDDIVEYTTLVRLKKYKANESKKRGYHIPKDIPPWDYGRVKEINDTKLPTMLIIDDSFGERCIPFLSESFSRSTYIFDSWQYGLNDSIVSVNLQHKVD